MNVPFLPLKRILEPLFPQLTEASSRVIQSGYYLLGPELEKFESEFAQYSGTKYAVGVGSGLDALYLTLKAFDLPEGSEVVIQANTFIATALAVKMANLITVPVDIDQTTGQLDISLLERAYTKKTKVIIPVHLYGSFADMDFLTEWAETHNVLILEDAAQAHGSLYKDRKAGSFGTSATFSFYPGKNLGALGDGGAVVTNDKLLAEKIRMLRNYGTEKKYHHRFAGTNSRLDEMQAALLLVRLKELDQENLQRQQVAAAYDEGLKVSVIKPLTVESDITSNYHLYPILTEKRELLQNYLFEHGIDTLIHYPIPIHKQEALPELHHLNFPVAEEFCDQVLSLPCFPFMTQEEINYVIEVICAFK